MLVPLDGSTAAEAILPYVEYLATASKARVLLMAAVDKPRDWGEDTSGDLKGERNEAEAYLQRLQGRLASATGSDVEIEVASDEPASAILAAAEKHHSELIAMTTHGRSGIARWVLGSVAAKLLHASQTPLLLVRPAGEGEKFRAPEIKRVLVPIDGSELSAAVLPFAGDLARSLRASVVLFHAVSEPAMAYPGTEAVLTDTAWQKAQAGARAFLDDVGKDIAAKGVEVEVSVSVGNATDAITWAAERENVDLIVMSTHGRSGLGRMVLGSVADGVARRTSLPVIVFRPLQKDLKG
jgi:nucleotide-binding universal stress UspA family protein